MWNKSFVGMFDNFVSIAILMGFFIYLNRVSENDVHCVLNAHQFSEIHGRMVFIEDLKNNNFLKSFFIHRICLIDHLVLVS